MMTDKIIRKTKKHLLDDIEKLKQRKLEHQDRIDKVEVFRARAYRTQNWRVSNQYRDEIQRNKDAIKRLNQEIIDLTGLTINLASCLQSQEQDQSSDASKVDEQEAGSSTTLPLFYIGLNGNY